MRRRLILCLCAAVAFCAACSSSRDSSRDAAAPALWQVYEDALKHAKYVDLTHAITPAIPVWTGFGPARFGPAVDPATGIPYTWAKEGFEATRYVLATDQLGTQLDP